MSPQTAYFINLPVASFPGQLADSSWFKDILSGQCVAAAMIYGILAVMDETNTFGFDALAVRVPVSAGDITTFGSALGVVVADQARAQDPTNPTNPQYPQFTVAPILKNGRIWVNAETAVTDGQPAFVRYASSINGSILGAFRADSDTISSVAHAAQLPNAVFRGTTTVAGFAVVELNLAW